MCDDLCSFSCLVGSYDMSSQNMFGDDTIASSTTSFTTNKVEATRDTSNSGYKTSESAKNEGGKVHNENDSPPTGPHGVKNDMSGDYGCLQYNSSGDSICKDINNRTLPFSRNISDYFSNPRFEKYKQEYSKNAFLRQVIASSLGTCVSVLTLNPISVLKLRLQRQDAFAETSVRGAFRTIYRKDGIRGFWAGSQIGLIQSLPSSVIYMTIYEKLKTELAHNSSGNFPSLIPGIAGGLARFYSATIIAPIEIIKTIQTGGRKESAITIAKYIYKNNGALGFYKGWSSTILRDVPFSFLYWVSYERLKIFYKKLFNCDNDINFSERLFSNIGTVTNAEKLHYGVEKDTAAEKKTSAPEYSIFLTFLSGSTSGVVAALATHPFDVLKTQQQLRTSEQLIRTNNGSASTCNYYYINNFNTIINNIQNKNLGSSSLNNNSLCGLSINQNINLTSASAQSSRILSNTEIFSSNNAYNVRMGVIEMEKIPPRKMFFHLLRDGFNNIAANWASSDFCKKCFPPEKDGLMRIVRERGIGGLYKGLNMRLLTVIPSSAIMVTVYEFVKKIDL